MQGSVVLPCIHSRIGAAAMLVEVMTDGFTIGGHTYDAGDVIELSPSQIDASAYDVDPINPVDLLYEWDDTASDD